MFATILFWASMGTFAAMIPAIMTGRYKWLAALVVLTTTLLLGFRAQMTHVHDLQVIADHGHENHRFFVDGDGVHYLVCHGCRKGGYYLGGGASYRSPDGLVFHLECRYQVKITKLKVICCYPGLHKGNAVVEPICDSTQILTTQWDGTTLTYCK
jgi:hypothetical protein